MTKAVGAKRMMKLPMVIKVLLVIFHSMLLLSTSSKPMLLILYKMYKQLIKETTRGRLKLITMYKTFGPKTSSVSVYGLLFLEKKKIAIYFKVVLGLGNLN